MKKIVIITLILQTLLSAAQQNVNVIYKVNIGKVTLPERAIADLGKENSEMLLNRLKESREERNKILKDFNFILKANSNESFYEWEEQIPDETVSKRDFEGAKRTGANGVYYQNKAKNQLIHQFKAMDGKWRRESWVLRDTAWTITKETDTILGYLVIKAVKKRTLKKSPHPMIPKVSKKVVWFAPAIPMPFGPKGYGGLPGLILRAGSIKATEIKFLKKPIKIKEPKKGELLDGEAERKKRIGEMDKLLGD